MRSDLQSAFVRDLIIVIGALLDWNSPHTDTHTTFKPLIKCIADFTYNFIVTKITVSVSLWLKFECVPGN